MIVALLVGGAALALAGTVLAAVPFAAAAAVAALDLDAATAPVVVWSAALAAGLLAVGMPPRRLVLPVAGCAAVLLALAAPNPAIIVPAWVLASGAAVLAGDGSVTHRRWGFALLTADLPLAAAMEWTLAGDGFLPWPRPLTAGVAALVALGAAAKVPLSSGPFERAPEGGLLVARTQAAALLVLLGTASPAVTVALLVAGAAAFGLATLSERAGTRDAVQELALVAVAVAAAARGLVSSGWVWGVLGAGTLLHVLRVAGRGRDPVSRTTWEVLRSGGFGSLYLPAVVGFGAAAVSAGGWASTVVLLGLVVGLAGRTRALTARDAPGVRWGPPPVMRTLLLAVAGAVALWAPLAGVPSRLGADAVSWPGWWALGVLAVGGGAGLAGARWLAPGRVRRLGRPVAIPSFLRSAGRLGDLAELRGALVAPALVSAVVAIVLWVLGITRGFL